MTKKDPLAGLVSHSERKRVVLIQGMGTAVSCGCSMSSWCDKHAPDWFKPRVTITPANVLIGVEETLVTPDTSCTDLDESDSDESPRLRGPLSED